MSGRVLAHGPAVGVRARRATGSPLFTVSLDGDVRAVNAALCALVDRAAEDLVGRPTSDLLVPSSESALCDVRVAAAGGWDEGVVVLGLRHGAGGIAAVRASWSVLTESDGRPAQLAVTCAPAAAESPDTPGSSEAGRVPALLHGDGGRQRSLAADLAVALAADALTLAYQPVVDLATQRVVGMEALARWDCPERGAIAPSVFVAAAEEAGLAPELDRWALQRGLRETARLRSVGALPLDAFLAVNLSAASLAARSLDQDVAAWAEQAGIPAGQVVLEITETAVMADCDLAVGVLRRLRERGFRVAIDDFGTGYSSLAYLRDLPVTTLKIDRSFVADVTTSPGAVAIVRSILDLASAVGVTVVAEGVETPQQAAVLRGLGCPAAQGWLWSRAVPPDQVAEGEDWLRPLRTTVTASSATDEHGLSRLVALHRTGASAATIAAALNAEGYRAPTGARWHRASVRRAVIEALADAPRHLRTG